ncbi:MAG: excinuclease ABC subunit UvrB [bacterium]
MGSTFKLQAPYKPTGDQPDAIAALERGLASGSRCQILEGVTGSGKTFTLANVIARYGRPALVISHNKTLAAQLYSELKAFFPDNAVEYFVSYYDYYQPEAYIPQTDTFIEKDASINKEIERLRLSATNSMLSREDVIIVSSVSCIYGLGSPDDYRQMVVEARVGDTVDRDELLKRLVDIQYTRNDYAPEPGTFRVRGDTVDVFPSYSTKGVRLDFFGDQLERAQSFDVVSGHVQSGLDHVLISPATHFVMPYDKIEGSIAAIVAEMEERIRWFEAHGKLLEAQRIKMRTMYDMEMLKEIGFCSGIENYSRHLSGRQPGEKPATLLSYFQGDFLTILDESHVTVPQIRGMFNGDQARKSVLVEHGFRLPSAKDNRPMNFEEFMASTGPLIFTSATPGPYEREISPPAVMQLIRPTGLVDPPVILRPLANQIDDVMEEIRAHAARGERVLVTTLTKRTSEDLAEYLKGVGLKVRYLHSDIVTIERVEILRSLRKGDFDCLIGVNLLREGLDLPEVSLVAVLDADKEGFLRSETSLIQTAGRAARHLDGKVILYADQITGSMKRMMEVTEKRRAAQLEYNRANNITPTSIQRSIQESLVIEYQGKEIEALVARESGVDFDIHATLREMEAEMLEAAETLEFERAAMLRDQIKELRSAAGLKEELPAAKKTSGATRYPTGRKRRSSGGV